MIYGCGETREKKKWGGGQQGEWIKIGREYQPKSLDSDEKPIQNQKMVKMQLKFFRKIAKGAKKGGKNRELAKAKSPASTFQESTIDSSQFRQGRPSEGEGSEV